MARVRFSGIRVSMYISRGTNIDPNASQSITGTPTKRSPISGKGIFGPCLSECGGQKA